MAKKTNKDWADMMMREKDMPKKMKRKMGKMKPKMKKGKMPKRGY